MRRARRSTDSPPSELSLYGSARALLGARANQSHLPLSSGDAFAIARPGARAVLLTGIRDHTRSSVPFRDLRKYSADAVETAHKRRAPGRTGYLRQNLLCYNAVTAFSLFIRRQREPTTSLLSMKMKGSRTMTRKDGRPAPRPPRRELWHAAVVTPRRLRRPLTPHDPPGPGVQRPTGTFPRLPLRALARAPPCSGASRPAGCTRLVSRPSTDSRAPTGVHRSADGDVRYSRTSHVARAAPSPRSIAVSLPPS